MADNTTLIDTGVAIHQAASITTEVFGVQINLMGLAIIPQLTHLFIA